MSEYIRTNKFDTNECPNIFVKEKLTRTNVRIYICDQYIWIFEYIRHTLIWIHMFTNFFKMPLKRNFNLFFGTRQFPSNHRRNCSGYNTNIFIETRNKNFSNSSNCPVQSRLESSKFGFLVLPGKNCGEVWSPLVVGFHEGELVQDRPPLLQVVQTLERHVISVDEVEDDHDGKVSKSGRVAGIPLVALRCQYLLQGPQPLRKELSDEFSCLDLKFFS